MHKSLCFSNYTTSTKDGDEYSDNGYICLHMTKINKDNKITDCQNLQKAAKGKTVTYRCAQILQ